MSVPEFIHLTDLDGHPVTIFLHSIVMYTQGANHDGAYVQLNLGGVSVRESYEVIKGRIGRLIELEDEARRAH